MEGLLTRMKDVGGDPNRKRKKKKRARRAGPSLVSVLQTLTSVFSTHVVLFQSDVTK